MHLFHTLLGLLIQTAYAQQTPIAPYCSALHPGCGAGRVFLIQLANRIINIASGVVGALAVGMLIWGAIKMITSGGNEEGKTQGRTIITTALVGVVLAIMAQALVQFVANFVLDVVPQ